MWSSRPVAAALAEGCPSVPVGTAAAGEHVCLVRADPAQQLRQARQFGELVPAASAALQVSVDGTAVGSLDGAEDVDPQLQSDLAANYKIERSRDFVEISDSAGKVIYRSGFFEEHPLAPITFGEPDRPIYQSRKLANQRFRLFNEQMDLEGRVFAVRLGRSMRDESATLDDFRRYLFWFAPILVLVVWVIGYGLSRRALARGA